MIMGQSEIVTENEYYEVDLRSRKTGDSERTIYSGTSYDEAWEVRNQWFKENLPDWNDDNDVSDLEDGSDGVYAYVYCLQKGDRKYGID